MLRGGEAQRNCDADGKGVPARREAAPSTSLFVRGVPPSSPAGAFRLVSEWLRRVEAEAPSAPGLLTTPDPSWPCGSGRRV